MLATILLTAPAAIELHGQRIAQRADQHARTAGQKKPHCRLLPSWRHEHHTANHEINVADQSDTGVNPAITIDKIFQLRIRMLHANLQSWACGRRRVKTSS